MPGEQSLDDLFLDTLKDIYYAEKKIVVTLPKLAKAAQSPELRTAFEQHLVETEGHVEGSSRFSTLSTRLLAARPAKRSAVSSTRARPSWTTSRARMPSTPG